MMLFLIIILECVYEIDLSFIVMDVFAGFRPNRFVPSKYGSLSLMMLS